MVVLDKDYGSLFWLGTITLEEVHEDIAEQFIEKMVAMMENTKFGNPLIESNLDMGPLVSKQQLEHVAGMVEKAVAEGAQVKTGGKVSSRTLGFHYEPTLLVNCRQDMEIIQQEIFGPVLPLVVQTENMDLKNFCRHVWSIYNIINRSNSR